MNKIVDIKNLLATVEPMGKKLPDKPSDLIDLALADLEKAEKSDDYIIEMNVWHKPNDDGKCLVCLAGAVMAFSLNFDREMKYVLANMPKNNQHKMSALNHFRYGAIRTGFNYMGIPFEADQPQERYITPYDESPEEFKSQIKRMVKEIRECGL